MGIGKKENYMYDLNFKMFFFFLADIGFFKPLASPSPKTSIRAVIRVFIHCIELIQVFKSFVQKSRVILP
jgi:hypothetical protein